VRPGDPTQLLGKVIDGRYEILQVIGEGGMGVVYRARQTSIDRMVAVKMLSSDLAKDRNWVQRFYNEAKACSRLHHPNTIKIFDFGQTRDGRLFMAMEFLDGLSLRQVISQQAPLDPMRVLKIVQQCCASLSEAHNLGIIHRDIKGDNVFLIDLPGSRDHVKLLDFGVAKLLMTEEFATQVGVVFGTPQYMSPEQGRGEPLTPRSDLYGVGILAYEMLTGSVPFSDPVPTNVLQMHLKTPVPPLPARVPEAVRQVVMRALEKEPSRRYQTAGAMMEDAQSVLGALQSGAFQLHPPAGTPESFPPLRGQSPQGFPVYPQPPHLPPRGAGAGGAANMPTVLDRPNPLLAGGAGRGPNVSAAAAAAASARTILVSTPGQATRPDGPQARGPSSPQAYPSAGMQGPDLRTVMLPNSEGMVSMSREGGGMPMMDSRGGPMLMHEAPRGGATAMFWILCLLTGLAVGVGAYWLVLELGK
jgi:eukaryotic-like serine/threonine-protein kinase